MNQQPVTKRDFSPDGRLWVHSIFGPTFQGEGPFAGTRCVFIRLQDCNLQCPGCDTLYHAPWGDRTEVQKKHWKPEDLIIEAMMMFDGTLHNRETRDLVVISGGEPFRQNLLPLLVAFEGQKGVFVQIETNGTLPPQFPDMANPDPYFYNTNPFERKGRYIVCSPKTPVCHPQYDAVACAFKYVLNHRSVDPDDGLPVHVLGNINKKRVYRQVHKVRPIYLQPMDHTGQSWDHGDPTPEMNNASSLDAVKKSCLKHGYIMQLQFHKLINVE